MKRFPLVTMALTLSLAWALPALEVHGRTYLLLTDVAGEMGYIVTESSNSMTVRAQAGVLVVFEDSPDVLWQPSADSGVGRASDRVNDEANDHVNDDVTLSAPVIRRRGGWYAPAELFALFEMELEGEMLVLPSGRRLTLEFPPAPPELPQGKRSERVELGNDVYALALFGPGGRSSLMLADAGLLSLAFPQQQPVVDAFMARLEEGKPLYFVVTSLAETSWKTDVVFSQGGRTFNARYPFSLSILAGEAGQVSPEAPVSGVILLPEWLNLRKPLSVKWQGAEAVFRFRR